MLATIPGRYPGTHPVQGGLRRRKPRRRLPPEVLTDAEVRALMNACGHSASGLRNWALIALLYRSGLRIREALELRPKDLDLAAGAVRVLWGKGGLSRVSGLDAGAAAVVARWIDVRACHGATRLSRLTWILDDRRGDRAFSKPYRPR